MTPLVEPPKPYDPHRRAGTWQPPAVPPADVARIRNAAPLAETVHPGALGRLAHREMVAWCDLGGRYGGHADMLEIAEQLEQRHRDLILGRTYG